MSLPALAPAHPLDLTDHLAEPYLYHDVTRPGFTSLVMPGGKPRQASFKLADLPAKLAVVRVCPTNVYLAQNEFFKPNRQVTSCWRLTSFYLDLDTYKIPDLGKRPAKSS